MQDAILQHGASWGDRNPHPAIKQIMRDEVNNHLLAAAHIRTEWIIAGG
jgi:hypothetical protein